MAAKINGKNIANLFFPEDVNELNLDSYFDCLKYDYDRIIKHFESANYMKVCIIKVEGQNPVMVEEGRHEFSGFQVSGCFVNQDEDKQVFRITSSIAKDIRIADIYSVHLASYLCNVLTTRTSVSWGALPVVNGVYSIAPVKSINKHLDNK